MWEALPPIFVVQLLGAVDDLVSPDDAVDIVVHKGDNASFVLIEMPDTTHHAAIEMRKPKADQREMLEDALGGGFAPDAKSLANVCRESSLTDQARFLLLAKAAGDSRDNLEKIAIARTHMADTLAATPDEKTTDVVFVIHGIRDKGFWTHKVVRAVKQQGEREQRVFRSFTRTYGYFAIFPFVLPWVRHWKTGWLMDHYALMRALYPGAKFSYVGHSNGAYLLARALLHYPAAKFHHVVFVGSVVRRDYPWSVLLPDKSENLDRSTRFSIMWRPRIGSSPFSGKRFRHSRGYSTSEAPDTTVSTSIGERRAIRTCTKPSSSSERMKPAFAKPIGTISRASS